MISIETRARIHYAFIMLLIMTIPAALIMLALKLLEPSRAGYWRPYNVDFPVHDNGMCYTLPFRGWHKYVVIDETKEELEREMPLQ